MKRLLLKVARFFGSWGFLKFILWTVTLIILLYVEEDWRGARAWAATKAEWEAKGESVDFNRLVPAPVPEDQNLAALPLFKVEPDPNKKGDLVPLTLQRAMRQDLPGNNRNFPHSGDWQAGQTVDVAAIRKGVAADYVEAFKKDPTGDTLTQFDALYPFVNGLRSAAIDRLYCRFLRHYPPQYPFEGDFALIAGQIQLARILELHAVIALDAHRPDVALSDIQLNFRVISGLTHEPFLVSGLVAIGMTAIGFTPLYDGLAQRAWNHVQLAQLQQQLGTLDFLSAYQGCMRGEAGIFIPMLDSLKSNRAILRDTLQSGQEDSKVESFAYGVLNRLWPNGWIDWRKAELTQADFGAVLFTDPVVHRTFPDRVGQQISANEKARAESSPFTLWSFFSAPASSVVTSAAMKFSRTQVWIDQAQIACALERYHRAHQTYPDTLDELSPDYIDKIPNDILSGRPYIYRRIPDGSYLLYSVGWDQIDGGGKILYKQDSPTAVDMSRGDWIWPAPQTPEKSSP